MYIGASAGKYPTPEAGSSRGTRGWSSGFDNCAIRVIPISRSRLSPSRDLEDARRSADLIGRLTRSGTKQTLDHIGVCPFPSLNLPVIGESLQRDIGDI